MNCFYHKDANAVGLCLACNRALCTECAVDLDRALACRDKCEHEVRKLLDLRDFEFAQPHHFIKTVKFRRTRHRLGAAISVIIGLTFIVVAYIFGKLWLAPIGLFPLFVAFLRLRESESENATRTDQFRLCPRCGYNLTGNTSGKCPECGFLA